MQRSTCRQTLLSVAVVMLLALCVTPVCGGDPEGTLLSAVYTCEPSGDDGLKTAVELEVENTAEGALQVVPFMISVKPDQLLDFRGADSGGGLKCEVLPQGTCLHVDVYPSAPIEPGAVYRTTLHYAVRREVPRSEETVELVCNNAVILWQVSGGRLVYRVPLPEGASLISTVPGGGAVEEIEGVRYIVQSRVRPMALWRVKYGTAVPGINIYGWLYITFIVALAAAAAVLLYARSTRSRVAGPGAPRDA